MDRGETVSDGTGIKVVGVGGGACAALDRMIARGLRGVECIAVDTSAQALRHSRATVKVWLGADPAVRRSSDGDPGAGLRAADASAGELVGCLGGADLVIIVATLGGGTGTGAAPTIARISQVLGALTVGVITKPFNFEGNRRRQVADEGAEALTDTTDTLIIVPNDRVLQLAEDTQLTPQSAFALADEALRLGVQGLTDTIVVPGLIHLAFGDLARVLSRPGRACVASGRASGANRAVDAARQALASPLLGGAIEAARGVLVTLTGSEYTLFEVHEAAAIIQEAADPDAIILFGAVTDDTMGEALRVTLIVCGIHDQPDERREVRRPSREGPWSGGPPETGRRGRGYPTRCGHN